MLHQAELTIQQRRFSQHCLAVTGGGVADEGTSSLLVTQVRSGINALAIVRGRLCTVESFDEWHLQERHQQPQAGCLTSGRNALQGALVSRGRASPWACFAKQWRASSENTHEALQFLLRCPCTMRLKGAEWKVVTKRTTTNSIAGSITEGLQGYRASASAPPSSGEGLNASACAFVALLSRIATASRMACRSLFD